ncbi:hypothetical protein ACLB2K_068320 [Fragaria x ananassa]
MKRELKKLEDELRDEKEANSLATSIFNEEKKSLEEVLKAKLRSLRQFENEFDEFYGKHIWEFKDKEAEAVNAIKKLMWLHAKLKGRDERYQRERVKLHSLIDKK